MDRRSIARNRDSQTLTPGAPARANARSYCHLRRQYRTIRPLPEPLKCLKCRTQNACEERALDHVRPASLRLSRLHRPSGPEDAEHRCDGQTRRAVLQRLCAVADLRPVADVVLYRPLHALARLALERLAAARRRTDARRSPEEDRRPQRAGRQDPHGARPRRPEESRHRAGLDHRRACVGMRLRAL